VNKVKEPLFPVWQIDGQEYRAVCAHLGVSPKEYLFEKLYRHLEKAPFHFASPKGFPLYLARLRLNRFRAARLDLASKLLFPKHPIRHILNGVIALHECDAEGYKQLSAVPRGLMVPLALLGWGLSFLASAIVTTGWLGWQFTRYLIGMPLRPLEQMAGKRILVTGVNRGLGRDLLLFALQQGAEVIGSVRNSDSLDALNTELPADAPVKLIVADISQTGALVNALKNEQITADTIDIAILCAGMKHSDASILDGTRIRETFEVNTFSSVDLAAWLCIPDHKSSLVLVSSIGRWHGMHSSCGYNASKAALSIWGESLQMELHLQGKQSCEVMVVEPGIFSSGMVDEKGLSKLLAVSRQDLAVRILSGALAGRKVMRPPFWFALLTWVVCLGGRGLRIRLFAHAKEGRNT
jgi:short-subunit dehydrogenase